MSTPLCPDADCPLASDLLQGADISILSDADGTSNDVDQSKAVAQAHGVSAMPTFVFLKNGSRVDELRGADVAGLQQRLIKHAGPAQPDFGASAAPVASGSGSSSSPALAGAGAPSVSGQIDKAQSSCLNEAEKHGIKELLSGGYLESDADEQLILSFATMQSLRLRALRFKTNADHMAHAPKAIKLFVNRPTIGFDDAEVRATLSTLRSSCRTTRRRRRSSSAKIRLRAPRRSSCDSFSFRRVVLGRTSR